jgi:hypothetical protein
MEVHDQIPPDPADSRQNSKHQSKDMYDQKLTPQIDKAL